MYGFFELREVVKWATLATVLINSIFSVIWNLLLMLFTVGGFFFLSITSFILYLQKDSWK